jgi:hypothetical protein
MHRARKCFKLMELHLWACSSAGRAPALQVCRLNHTSSASGVAYADSRGATTLLNWTEVGPNCWREPLEAALNGSRITSRITSGLLFITPNWCWNRAETVENYSYFSATMGSTRMA